MPAPQALANKLNRFVEKALATNIALDINTHVTTELGSQKKRISWAEQQPFNPLAHPMGTLAEYLYYLRDRHFSLVNLDGSLLQISFEVHKGVISSHRLNFVPCPVDLDLGLLALDSLDNVVEQLFLNQPAQEVKLRSAIRFDYDPAAASVAHASSHLTVNYSTVRIPVSRYFDAATFLDFIWRNFFSGRDVSCGSDCPVAGDECGSVLDAHHLNIPHLHWNIAPAVAQPANN